VRVDFQERPLEIKRRPPVRWGEVDCDALPPGPIQGAHSSFAERASALTIWSPARVTWRTDEILPGTIFSTKALKSTI
jgi:hypothetical protein